MKATPRKASRQKAVHQGSRTQSASRWTAYLILLFVVSLGWRWAYLARLSGTSLAESLSADAAIYWEWAEFIRAHGLIGSQPFFLGPLYPYLLAALQFSTGDDIGRVLGVQAVWGSLSVVLLADAARRVAGRPSGVLVGALLCFYEMAVFFDGLVLAESLLFFLESALLWFVARTNWGQARWPAFAVVGGLVGLLTEARATGALLLIPALLILVDRRAPTPWKHQLVALLAGWSLVAAPVAVRNVLVSREWIPFTYNLGYNLYVGNHPDATGAYAPIAGANVGTPYSSEDGGGEIDGRAYLRLTEGVTLTPAESSKYWTRKAAAFISAHPMQAITLAVRKLGLFWNRREYAQVENVREFRERAGPIGAPWIGTFAVLGPLALAGLWFAARQGLAARFAIGYVVAMSVAVMPFFVTDRYRIHLVPGAALLAAIAIERIVAALRQQSIHPSSLRLIGALLLGVILVHLPALHLDPAASAWIDARNRGERYLNQGELDQALREFERALALERTSAIRLGGDMATRVAQAQLHFSYASALRRRGRHAEAVPWLVRANREAPDHPFVIRALAESQASLGAPAQSDSLYAALNELPGGAGLSLASRGWHAARAGDFSRAEQFFASALEKNPRFPEAWGALIRVQAQTGKLSEAAQSLRRASTAGLPKASVHAYSALLHAANGDAGAAARELAKVPDHALADQTIADVVQTTRRLLGTGSPLPQ